MMTLKLLKRIVRALWFFKPYLLNVDALVHEHHGHSFDKNVACSACLNMRTNSSI